uniref:Uncharacterized protein n=1 Tax=Varanus komodoensis TaxID=61221 RepID=A0A8D2J5L6_VARKO
MSYNPEVMHQCKQPCLPPPTLTAVPVVSCAASAPCAEVQPPPGVGACVAPGQPPCSAGIAPSYTTPTDRGILKCMDTWTRVLKTPWNSSSATNSTTPCGEAASPKSPEPSASASELPSLSIFEAPIPDPCAGPCTSLYNTETCTTPPPLPCVSSYPSFSAFKVPCAMKCASRIPCATTGPCATKCASSVPCSTKCVTAVSCATTGPCATKCASSVPCATTDPCVTNCCHGCSGGKGTASCVPPIIEKWAIRCGIPCHSTCPTSSTN